MKKKGILVVSFGTSYQDISKKTIDACEKRIAESFPDYEVRRAFTSNIIRKKLKQRDNLIVDNTIEALQKMKKEDFGEVIVQPLHIIPGEEYHEKILKEAIGFINEFEKIIIGRPILSTIEDYRNTIEALKLQLEPMSDEQAVILMGHGTKHPANACYSCLQLIIAENNPNIFVANVEGYPELEDVLSKLKKRKLKEVTLMPFMLVAGDHALNDMVGDDEDSWKNILEQEGYKVNTYLKGLGENKGFQNIYIKLIQDCIDGKPQGY